MKRKLTETEGQSIAELRKRGMTICEISESLKLNLSKVYKATKSEPKAPGYFYYEVEGLPFLYPY